MAAKNELGRAGENYAVSYLTTQGYAVLDRNWRCGRIGEIDIIATKDPWLVFVEVKTRSTTSFGYPAEAITHTKLKRMRHLAVAWCAQNKPRYSRLRLDVIALIFHSSGTPTVEHLENVSS